MTLDHLSPATRAAAIAHRSGAKLRLLANLLDRHPDVPVVVDITGDTPGAVPGRVTRSQGLRLMYTPPHRRN